MKYNKVASYARCANCQIMLILSFGCTTRSWALIISHFSWTFEISKPALLLHAKGIFVFASQALGKQHI